MQLVRLLRNGEPFKMSKRSGDLVLLSDVVEEVGVDATRFMLLTRRNEQAMDFDFALVKEHTRDNPVFYVQYAHARIASIGRVAAERGITRRSLEETDLSVLRHERELDLLRSLSDYPDVLATAAQLRAPHRVTTWVREFAGRFHGFYRDCRVITADPVLTQARLWLAEACRVGLKDALGILGVGAPEVMERLDRDDEDDAESAPA
jgi:arginyl-tRNA synthetase